MDTRAVVLAAGEGTRMNSDLPKVCHRCFGEPMLIHVLRSLGKCGCEQSYVVVGVGKENVNSLLPESARSVVQEEQLGTGDALQSVLSKSSIPDRTVLLVTCGDIPGVKPATYQRLLDAYGKSEAALVMLTAQKENPAGYGRVVTENKSVLKIVEAKDASEREKKINLVNTGLLCGRAGMFRKWLPEIQADNAANEYYLTDIVELLVEDDKTVRSVEIKDDWQVRGINTRKQLVEFEKEGYQRQINKYLGNGVTIHTPERVKIGPWVKLEKDVEIDGSLTLWGETSVAEGTRFVGPTTVFSSKFGPENFVLRSHITAAEFGARVRIGPFSHVRPGSKTGDDVRLGNFVETKKTTIKSETNVSHLSYVGDAEIGRGANLGAGTITCNYDGYEKYKTIIGDEVFVGSNCELVAPVEIKSGAIIGAGSTIIDDVPADSLALSRVEQQNKNNWVEEEWKPRKEQELDKQ